jgi:adenine-specific DNA-methyltransferase
MSNDGSIFESIDDKELYSSKYILDAVFGQENFVANVIWQKNFSPKNSARYFSVDHDYILVFAKNKDSWEPRLLPRSQGAEDRYSNIDNDPRGPWTSGDLTARNYYGDGTYLVNAPNGATYKPSIGSYWRVSKKKFMELDSDGRIWWGEDGGNMPRLKRFLSEVKDGVVPQTLWKYQDVGHTQDAKRELISTVKFDRTEDVLNTVKPSALIQRAIHIAGIADGDTWVLDFFAGSGTTAHAVLRQNGIDGNNRKFILCEAADYASSMTRQRVIRAIHSVDWKDGVAPNTSNASHLVKCIRLESYEDALDNLALTRSADQNALLDRPDAKEFREDYVLRYMLDVESRASLLNLARFEDPFNVTMTITRNDETKQVAVDLVETFNYLLGLRVKTTERVRGVLEVTGISPDGERVLVLWRNVHQTDNDALDQWFDKRGYRSRDMEFDAIYVNGDNNIPNLRRTDETWKVRLIEEAFHELMFDVRDV